MPDFGFKNGFRARPKKRIGLDIGAFSLKVIEISAQQERPAVSAAGLKRIGDPARESAAAAIKALMEESGISGREVAISAAGQSSTVRFLSMPKMRDDELKSAIRFEAERAIPFDINECVIDFQVIKRDEKERKLHILLAAAKRDYIDQRIALAESAGLSVAAVDIDSFAAANSFLKSAPASSGVDRTCAILNIGAALTNLSIVHDGTLWFARDVAIGGNDFSSAVAARFGIDKASAEELKVSPQERMAEVAGCVKAVLSNLLEEARLSFNYYENQYGRSVDEIYVCGGSTGLVGLDAAFQEAFGTKPSVLDPAKSFGIEPAASGKTLLESSGPLFAVAAGLALR